MVGAKVKALLALTGTTHRELAEALSISPQALSNKFQKDSFSVSDLIGAADFFGCRLNFEFPNGSKITFSNDDRKTGGY